MERHRVGRPDAGGSRQRAAADAPARAKKPVRRITAAERDEALGYLRASREARMRGEEPPRTKRPRLQPTQAMIDAMNRAIAALKMNPRSQEVRDGLEENLLTAEALANHWLATEPGAQRLVERDGRSALETLARSRRALALEVGEASRLRGATWDAARAAVERAVHALD